MRRTLPAVVTVLLAVAACSGDDDASAAITTTTTPTTVGSPVDVPVATDRCEDEPDLADYPEGGAPTAIRPCELPDELVKITVRDGIGRPVEAGDGVVYHATAIRSSDAALIESTWRNSEPAVLPIIGRGGPIAGLDIGLLGVQTGEVLRLHIPPDLAYGDAPPADGAGTIRAGDAISYVIEVLAVVPTLRPDDAPIDVDVAPSINATELRIDDLIEGTGKVVEEGDRVVVAMLLARGDNEVIIFNSWDQGNPVTIPLDRSLMDGPDAATLPGIFDGLIGARVGGRRAIAMPPELAWGEDGLPTLGLPPGVDLIAVVDVIGAF